MKSKGLNLRPIIGQSPRNEAKALKNEKKRKDLSVIFEGQGFIMTEDSDDQLSFKRDAHFNASKDLYQLYDEISNLPTGQNQSKLISPS